MTEIKIDLEIQTSHRKYQKDHELFNSYIDGATKEDFSKLIITHRVELVNDDELIKISMKKAQVATFALSLLETELQNGCPYFIVNWKERNEKVDSFIQIDEVNNMLNISDTVTCRDYLTIQKQTIIDVGLITNYMNSKIKNDTALENYYYACMTNNIKSKYFYLFIIIESYEGSKDFLDGIDNELLFTEKEANELLQIIQKYDKRKKDSILGILNRTKLSRKEKLFNYLDRKSLSVIKNNQISLEDIGSIIDQRNKLFHSSSTFNEELLFGKLFPLVKAIIKEIEFGFA